MAQKYIKLDGRTVKKIGDNLYVPESEKSNMLSGNPVVPVFFARTCWTHILHDSPVIGAWEYGESFPDVLGPFFTEEAATKAVEEKQKEKDYVSWDFSSEIVARMYSVGSVPEFSTFLLKTIALTAEQTGFFTLEIGGHYCFKKEEFLAVYSQIPDFARAVEAKIALLAGEAGEAKPITGEYRQDGNFRLFAAGNSLVETRFSEGLNRWSYGGRSFSMRIFSKEGTADMERIMLDSGVKLPVLSIMRRERKYIIESPGPKIAVSGHKCLEDFIRANDFIY